tara:strand:- start:71 stop:526 length:456 start_codon:yes stop_codon:yes gene_type:complete
MQEKINKSILLIIIGWFYSIGIGILISFIDYLFGLEIWKTTIGILPENPLLRIISIPIAAYIFGFLGELIFPLIDDKKNPSIADVLQNFSNTKKKSSKDWIKSIDKLDEDIEKIKRRDRKFLVKLKDFFDEYKIYIILFIILTGTSVLLTP